MYRTQEQCVPIYFVMQWSVVLSVRSRESKCLTFVTETGETIWTVKWTTENKLKKLYMLELILFEIVDLSEITEINKQIVITYNIIQPLLLNIL